MCSPRFLVIVLLLPIAGFAQNQNPVFYSDPLIPPVDSSLFAHPDPLAGGLLPLPLDSQRSLLEPKTAINPFTQSPDNSQDFALSDQAKPLEGITRYLASRGFDPKQFIFRVSPQGQIPWERDRFCLSIRSYLMARDSKDSDSTHLVSTSTCQPATQYSLKTTDPGPHMLQR